MQKSGRVLILLGFVLAVLAAGASLYALNSITRTAPSVKLKKVVVAQQGIAAYGRIEAAALLATEWPESAVGPDAFTDPADVIGKLATTQIVVGQILAPSMVVDKDAEAIRKGFGSSASYALPDDKVAVAFPIDPISGVAAGLKEGDHVDVLVSYDLVISGTTQTGGVAKRQITQVALQDVEILRVGLWSTPPPTDGAVGATKDAPNVTFAVTQQDALVLKFLRETGSGVQLALRAAGNHRIVKTQPIIFEYIDQRFNFGGQLLR